MSVDVYVHYVDVYVHMVDTQGVPGGQLYILLFSILINEAGG